MLHLYNYVYVTYCFRLRLYVCASLLIFNLPLEETVIMYVGPHYRISEYNYCRTGADSNKVFYYILFPEQFSRRISDEDITENFLGARIQIRLSVRLDPLYSGPRDFISTFRSGARIRGFNIQDDVSELRKRHYAAI